MPDAGYNITLNPGNMMGSADSGTDLTFDGLSPSTSYTYTATLTGVSGAEYQPHVDDGISTTSNMTSSSMTTRK